jgi:hypothetical protein
MSEEQKQGIVVNPFHHAGAEAPQGGAQGNVGTSSAQASDSAATIAVQTPQQQGQEILNAQGSPISQPAPVASTLPNVPTASADTSCSGESSQSTSPANGDGTPSVGQATPEGVSWVKKIEGAIEGEVAKIEGAIEGAVEGAENAVKNVVQEVKDVIQGNAAANVPQTPAAPVVTGTIVSNNANGAGTLPQVANSANGLKTLVPQQPNPDFKGSPSPVTNVLGTQDRSLKVEAPAVVAKEEAVVLPAVQTGISEVDQIVEKLMSGASMEAQIIVNTIKEYIVKMKPGKPIAQKDGILQQVGFYNALLSAINNLEGDFRPTMQAILALLHHHREGAFKETHVFRFVEHIPLSTDHRFGFRKIITLLKTLANPQTRQQLVHQIHFENITKYGLSERGRVKLAAFFGK